MIGTREERLIELDKLYPVWEKHTIWSLFEKTASAHAQQEFLCFEDCSFSYSDIKAKAEKVARALSLQGVRPGDRIEVRLYNSPEYVILLLALSKIGAVKVPLNPRISQQEHEWIRENAKISRSFVKEDVTALMEGALSPEEPVADFSQADDVCDIIFTSGSTGHPKGVMLTHDTLLRSAYGTCRQRCMEIGRRIYVAVPLFHVMGYVEGLLTALLVGGTAIMSTKSFRPETAVDLMRSKHANDIVCISTMMVDILSKTHPTPEQFPDMHAAYWAAACPNWTWEAGRKAFGIQDVTTGYGMTECGSTTVMMSPTDDPELLPHCHGRLKNGGSAGFSKENPALLEIQIQDPFTGIVVPTGEKGEICCKGLTLCAGYDSVSERPHNLTDEEGWFHTGDLGTLNEDGYLTFCGRLDDNYKMNGENVSPAYVDRIIGHCEAVQAVQVVGIPYGKYGEVGTAFIDLKVDTAETRTLVQGYCKENLASYQVPHFYVFGTSESWPRTASGKVKKKALQQQAKQMLMNGWLDGNKADSGSCGGHLLYQGADHQQSSQSHQ